MLEALLGNRTAEKVLLHLYHYGEVHASAIASDLGVAVNPIRMQLERFESGGLVYSKLVGRARVFGLNPKSPFAEPIKAIARIAYESIPLEERVVLFGVRRRPRRKGKEVIRKA